MNYKKLLKTYAVDVITIAILVGIFMLFSSILASKAYAISNGMDAATLQQQILSGVQDAKAFADASRNFALYLIFGSIIIFAISFMIYSFSRKMIYDLIKEKKINFRSHLKWNGVIGMNLLVAIPFLILSAILLMVMNLIFAVFNSAAHPMITSILISIFLIGYTYFTIIVGVYFSDSYKVFSSISKTFNYIKSKWSLFWKKYLAALVIFIIIGLLISLLGRKFYSSYAIIASALYLLYLAWLRLYVYQKKIMPF